ncbi:hypothetical protein J2T13_000035 [Paenibacillus sp. DS2015]
MLDIREMTIADYEMSMVLWARTAGMGLSEADSKDSIDTFLRRNDRMS